MDYEALARKYGGAVAEAPKTDYEALARKYGGRMGDAIPGARTGEPDNSAAQWSAVAARAAAPYAAAMGAGALGGAAVGGPVGAGLGAAAAPIALGIGDIGTGLYNVVATPFGAQRVPLPSETIQGAAERIGIGRRAQTPEQQIFESTVQGALGGGIAARAASAIAPALSGPVARGVATEMGKAPVLQAAGGAGAGAASMGANVYGGVDNPLVLMGAGMMGAAAPTFVRAGGDLARRGFNVGINKLADIADPKAAAYMQAVEGRAPEVINALRQAADSPVPGYERTAMQAATEAGAPGFQSLGQQAAKLRAAAAFERGEGQREALQRQMQRVGGTDEELAAMQATRKATTEPLYQRADQVRVQVDDELGNMLMRPDMREAVKLARRAAENEGKTFGENPTLPPDRVSSKFIWDDVDGVTIVRPKGTPEFDGLNTVGLSYEKTENGLRIRGSYLPADVRGQGVGSAMYEAIARKANGQGLPLFSDDQISASAARVFESLKRKGFNVKRSADVDIDPDNGTIYSTNIGQPVFTVEPPRPSFTGAELHRVKKALDDLKKKAAAQGTDTGETLAQSIGGMQKDFLEWVGKRIPEYDAARGTFESQSKLISQVEAGRFLEQSLFPALEGQPMQPGAFARAQRTPPKEMVDKMAELTPTQRQQIGEVTAELARDLQAQRMATQGRGVAPNIESLSSEAAGERVNMLNKFMTITNSIINRVQGAVDKKLAMEIAREMLEPEIAARALERAMKQRQSWQSWQQTPKGGAAPIFTQSQIQNLLAGQQQVPEQNRMRELLIR